MSTQQIQPIRRRPGIASKTGNAINNTLDATVSVTNIIKEVADITVTQLRATRIDLTYENALDISQRYNLPVEDVLHMLQGEDE